MTVALGSKLPDFGRVALGDTSRLATTDTKVAYPRRMSDGFGDRAVFIKHDRAGLLFELPRGHSIVMSDPDENGEQAVSLAAGPGDVSIFVVGSIEEQPDKVTIALGYELGRKGAAKILGDNSSEPNVRGYPFPTG
jgi:hypothetical protein